MKSFVIFGMGIFLFSACSSAPKAEKRTPSSASSEKLSTAFERAVLAREKLKQSARLSQQAESLRQEGRALEIAELGGPEVFDLLQKLKTSANCQMQLKLNYRPDIHFITGTINGTEVGSGSGPKGVGVNPHEMKLSFLPPREGEPEQFYLESTGYEGHRVVFTQDMKLSELRLANVDYCK